MAVSRTVAWTDSTGVVNYAAAARLKSIRVTKNPSGTTTSYLQLFNATSATPGSDTPVLVLPLHATGINETKSFPFPHGINFATGICSFVATTLTGGTAATTSVPLAVDIHYTPVA